MTSMELEVEERGTLGLYQVLMKMNVTGFRLFGYENLTFLFGLLEELRKSLILKIGLISDFGIKSLDFVFDLIWKIEKLIK
jgi:hypothetical protein